MKVISGENERKHLLQIMQKMRYLCDPFVNTKKFYTKDFAFYIEGEVAPDILVYHQTTDVLSWYSKTAPVSKNSYKYIKEVYYFLRELTLEEVTNGSANPHTVHIFLEAIKNSATLKQVNSYHKYYKDISADVEREALEEKKPE